MPSSLRSSMAGSLSGSLRGIIGLLFRGQRYEEIYNLQFTIYNLFTIGLFYHLLAAEEV